MVFSKEGKKEETNLNPEIRNSHGKSVIKSSATLSHGTT